MTCDVAEDNTSTFSLENTSLLQAWAQRPDTLLEKHFVANGVSVTPLLSPCEAFRCQHARPRGRVGHSAGGHRLKRQPQRAQQEERMEGWWPGLGHPKPYRRYMTDFVLAARASSDFVPVQMIRLELHQITKKQSNRSRIKKCITQHMHNPAYVRTLLAPGSGEVQVENVAKAQSLFTESVEGAVKVISSFLLCVIAFANRGAPAIVISAGSSSCSYLSWSARSCGHS